jgi:hypothetical protein
MKSRRWTGVISERPGLTHRSLRLGSLRHLVGRFPDWAALRACYEAGRYGFELHGLLASSPPNFAGLPAAAGGELVEAGADHRGSRS